MHYSDVFGFDRKLLESYLCTVVTLPLCFCTDKRSFSWGIFSRTAPYTYE